jgi:hypothetical protein
MAKQTENEMQAQEQRQSLLAEVKAPPAQTLIEVSEEQLQQITGGSGIGDDASFWRAMSENSANNHVRNSQMAEAKAIQGNLKAAKVYAEDASFSKHMAQEYQKRADALDARALKRATDLHGQASSSKRGKLS